MDKLQRLATQLYPAKKLNADGVPSASIAILNDGKISSNVITNGKENDETVYQACSISKPITAVAVAKLVDQEKLSYDTKVIDHLPQSTIDCLVDEKTSHLLSHVTVGMLLSHTSGLSQGGFPGYPGEPASAEETLSGRYPSNTIQVHFLAFPGAKWSYSGGGTTVLQVFLENYTKTPFIEFMRTTVLEPLGMTRSWYGRLPADEHNYTDAYWTAYTKSGRNVLPEAAAGLWTTPTDLLKAISAVQESLYTNNGFISQATAKKMLFPMAEISLTKGASMCAGWAVDDLVFAHSGSNDPGYRCFVFGFNDAATQRRDGIAVMTNSVLGSEAIQRIVIAIYWLQAWERTKMLPTLFGDDNEFAPLAGPEDAQINELWRKWMGKWQGSWEIVDDGGPALVFGSFKPVKLRPAAAPVDSGKDEFVFVPDGLKFGLRLTWEDDERVVQLLQPSSKTLKKI